MDDIAQNKLPADAQEIDFDEFHPSNDEHFKAQKNVQNIIVAHQRQMRPNHVQVVKAHFAGHNNVKISEMLNLAPATVGNILKRPDAQQLLHYLNYYQAAKDGMSIEHRKAMLRRIAVRNETSQPKVTMQAIAELNKMDVNENNIELSKGGPAQTSIVINQTFMPRTTLDD